MARRYLDLERRCLDPSGLGRLTEPRYHRGLTATEAWAFGPYDALGMPNLSALWRAIVGLLAICVFAAGSLALVGASPRSAAGGPMITSSGPTSCRDMPVSGALVHPISCWVIGSTSVVIAGAIPGNPGDGRAIVVRDQVKQVITLAGSGAPRVKSATADAVCLQTSNGRVSCVPTGVRTMAAIESDPQVAASGPTPSSSYYVYGAYVDQCGPTATTGCPLYVDGSNAPIPSTGGLTVLDFGAPCYDPNTLAWGTQLFVSQSCTPDRTLVTLAESWIRGYQTNPHRSSSPPLIVAVGTSNSLTAAVPGNALTQAQMSSHGQAWFTSVVHPIQSAVASLTTPVVVWSGNDIEESSSGDWYEATRTRAWVDAYGSAAGAQKPCGSSTASLMVDYGDYVKSAPGWTPKDVYAVAWGAPVACALPEIYYSANATEWAGLATDAGSAPVQFTGVMSLDAAPNTNSLSAADSWNQLATATNQSPAYLRSLIHI